MSYVERKLKIIIPSMASLSIFVCGARISYLTIYG